MNVTNNGFESNASINLIKIALITFLSTLEVHLSEQHSVVFYSKAHVTELLYNLTSVSTN